MGEWRVVRGVLFDLGAVHYVGDRAPPGAVKAVTRLRHSGLSVRCLPNTGRKPRHLMLGKLHGTGVAAEAGELFTRLSATRAAARPRGAPLGAR